MFKQTFNKRQPLRFKQFSRKGYALFSCLGKEVVIGVLSVATLSNAKAEGISTKPFIATDTLSRDGGSLDEVVITGSRAPLTALQAAKLVAVVTREDIQRTAAQSLNDVLKLATGVDVRQRGGFGVQTDISINGGTFDQITILLNGVNISNPQTGHNATDFPVALSDIERIEVLEGAASRVVGATAFNGAINIVTHRPQQQTVGMEAAAGSFGTVTADASAHLTTKQVGTHLSAGYARSDGGTQHSDFEKTRFYYQGTLDLHRVDILWQAAMSLQNFGANTFYSARYDNQYENTKHGMASVTARIKELPSHLEIVPALYFNRFTDHYQLIRGERGAAMGENYHQTDAYGASLNAHLKWVLGTTAFGTELRKEHIWSTAYGEEQPLNKQKGIAHSDRSYTRQANRTNTSLFLEHNIIAGGLTISAGLLANNNTKLSGGFKFYPGIDISYRHSDHWKWFISWNKALRMPTFTDMYANNAVQQGDVTLMPERNTTYKAGAIYRTTGMESTASAFYSHGKDMIDWVYETELSTRYHALNIGKLNNMGASAEVKIRPVELWENAFVTHIGIGYAYIHQHHESRRPIYRSLYALEYLRHKLTLSLSHHIWSKLTAHWSARWQQRMNGYHPYTKVDCKLLWNADRYQLYLKADNITCHRYYDLGGVKQPGIWLMAGGKVNIHL